MSEPVVRVEPVDLLMTEDGALLLYDREVLRLSLLAGAVFEWCAEPRTVAELARLLVDEFGAPPSGDIEDATAAIVAELRDRGVLRA